MVSPIYVLYWFTYLRLFISSASKPHFSTRNWQNKNEYKIKLILTKYEAWWLFIWVSHHFNYPQVCTLTSNSLLSMRNFSLALVIRLSLTYPHLSDKAYPEEQPVKIKYDFSLAFSIFLLAFYDFKQISTLTLTFISEQKLKFSTIVYIKITCWNRIINLTITK